MAEVNFNTQRVEATSCRSMDGKKQVEQNLVQVWLPSKWPGSTSGQFLVLKCVTGKDTLGIWHNPHTGIQACSRQQKGMERKPRQNRSPLPGQITNQKSSPVLALFKIRGHQCGPIISLWFPNLAASKPDREDDSGLQRLGGYLSPCSCFVLRGILLSQWSGKASGTDSWSSRYKLFHLYQESGSRVDSTLEWITDCASDLALEIN